jgi:hypothetical protein
VDLNPPRGRRTDRANSSRFSAHDADADGALDFGGGRPDDSPLVMSAPVDLPISAGAECGFPVASREPMSSRLTQCCQVSIVDFTTREVDGETAALVAADALQIDYVCAPYSARVEWRAIRSSLPTASRPPTPLRARRMAISRR